MAFSLDDAKKLVEGGIGEAQELLKNPSKIDGLLEQLEDKLRGIPVGGDLLASVPLMIAMVKSYINGSYKEVSPKVIASLVAAFLYLVKRKDLIPDSILLIGKVDDIAVMIVAMKVIEPEINAYKAWKETQQQ